MRRRARAAEIRCEPARRTVRTTPSFALGHAPAHAQRTLGTSRRNSAKFAATAAGPTTSSTRSSPSSHSARTRSTASHAKRMARRRPRRAMRARAAPPPRSRVRDRQSASVSSSRRRPRSQSTVHTPRRAVSDRLIRKQDNTLPPAPRQIGTAVVRGTGYSLKYTVYNCI